MVVSELINTFLEIHYKPFREFFLLCHSLREKQRKLAGAGEQASEKCMSHSGIFEIFSGEVLSMEENGV